MTRLPKKYIHIATWKERYNDILALYDLKHSVRKEAEDAGIVTKNSIFPLSMGFSYITKQKNIWILKMKYRNYAEWKDDCEDNVWEFQICRDKESGELYAVRPFKLPSGKVVCCIFSPLSFKEYVDFYPVTDDDICSVMNALLDLLDMESIIEYEGKLYITSKNMFIVGTPLTLPEHSYLFDKQIFYRSMKVDVDIPYGACMEMLHRSNKLSMEWEKKEDIQFMTRAFFKKYISK